MTEKKTRSREGWTRVRFGDVVTNVNDQPKRASLPLATRYVAGEHVDENRLRIDRWGTLGDELVPPTFRRRFGPSDVLFHSRNLKKIAVPDFGGITGEKLFVLRSTSPHLLQDFLPYVLLSPAFTTYAESSWSGSVNKFLNWTPLAKYEFDLPPVEEQRSVLVLLNHFADLESELDRLAKSAADLRDSLRSTIAGSTKGRRKLNELASFVTSGSRGWSQYYADDGHVFLRIANLNGPTLALNTADLQRVRAPDDAESSRTQVQRNDVLLGITGEAGVGLVGIVRDHEQPTYVSQHVAMIRLNEAVCCPEFIAHSLAGPLGQQQIERFNQPGAKAGMTLIAVRDLEVPDLPLSEQQKCARRLSAVEQSMLVIRSRTRMAAMQKQQALNGGLAKI